MVEIERFRIPQDGYLVLDLGDPVTGTIMLQRIVESPLQVGDGGRRVLVSNIQGIPRGRHWAKVTLVNLQRRKAGEAAVSFNAEPPLA